MAALTNTSDSTALNAALDQEFIANFQHDSDRLAEILGIFGTETLAAGTTLKMLKITGTLNNGKTEGTQVGATGTGAVTLGSSSGTSYVEGDEVALSKFSAEYEAVAEVFGVPYRKMTTANAIQKSGYVNAVLKTDQKMLSQVRGGVVSDFFTFLGNGTGTASAKGLQAALATADATLGDKLEDNGDEAGRIIHFVNRQDAAAYLGLGLIDDPRSRLVIVGALDDLAVEACDGGRAVAVVAAEYAEHAAVQIDHRDIRDVCGRSAARCGQAHIRRVRRGGVLGRVGAAREQRQRKRCDAEHQADPFFQHKIQ